MQYAGLEQSVGVVPSIIANYKNFLKKSLRIILKNLAEIFVDSPPANCSMFIARILRARSCNDDIAE